MFKPKFIPTLFTIPAIIVLLILGSWQVQRLNWKNNLIESMNLRISMPAIDLPELTSKDNIDEYKYRKVKLKGEFLNDHEIFLFTGPKVMKGDAGYNILTPFQTDKGQIVLVDRGWIPSDKREQSTRPETIINEPTTIEGMLHEGEKQAKFVFDNDVENNLWFWIDTKAISKVTGQNLKDIYVRITKNDNGNILPIPGENVIKHRNDHLQYAVIWYSFAIILLIIYIIYHKKNQ